MLHEIALEALTQHTARFPGAQLAMVLASVAAGNTAAQLWVAADDTTALLWDKGNNVFYLAGACSSDQLRSALAQLIATQIGPQARAEGSAYFKTRALVPEEQALLPQLFEGIALTERDTLFYGLGPTLPQPPAPQLEGVQFALIDRALLERAELENIAELRAEIGWMWPSEQRFHTHGFGYAALLGQRLVCWCTAEYASAQQCGIGIQTEAAYQQRGVASATAARFVGECAQRGVKPFWECTSANLPSRRVAEKVGFELIEEARFLVGAF